MNSYNKKENWIEKIHKKWRVLLSKLFLKLLKEISLLPLRRVDQRIVPSNQSEIRLFAILRNESLRLPHFITYYKKLQVDRFFFIDNNSTDNSQSIVLAESDCHLFKTDDNYQDHWFWMEYLLEKYGKNHWCIVVDIDELFAYPHSDYLSIKNLCSFLDRTNNTAIRAFLLDMYSNQSILNTEYTAGKNPLEIIDCFDSEYTILNYSFHDRSNWDIFYAEIFSGGMRDRVFGKSSPPAILTKIPLFKNVDGTYLVQGMHAINGAILSELQGVVFHTKFLFDFIDEVENECTRQQHSNNAFYYKLYQKKMGQDPSLYLSYEKSVKFENLNQLISLGIMKSSTEFELYLEQLLGR